VHEPTAFNTRLTKLTKHTKKRKLFFVIVVDFVFFASDGPLLVRLAATDVD
jgi:hypothetical protein